MVDNMVGLRFEPMLCLTVLHRSMIIDDNS